MRGRRCASPFVMNANLGEEVGSAPVPVPLGGGRKCRLCGPPREEVQCPYSNSWRGGGREEVTTTAVSQVHPPGGGGANPGLSRKSGWEEVAIVPVINGPPREEVQRPYSHLFKTATPTRGGGRSEPPLCHVRARREEVAGCAVRSVSGRRLIRTRLEFICRMRLRSRYP